MTRTVADAALLLSVIQRFDARDVYALPPDDTDYLAKILKLREARPLAGKKLAFTTRLGGHDTPEAIAKPIREAAERFRELGAIVEEKEPALPDLLPVFTILWFAGAGQVLRTIAEEDQKKLDPGFLDVAAQAREYVRYAGHGTTCQTTRCAATAASLTRFSLKLR